MKVIPHKLPFEGMQLVPKDAKDLGAFTLSLQTQADGNHWIYCDTCEAGFNYQLWKEDDVFFSDVHAQVHRKKMTEKQQ